MSHVLPLADILFIADFAAFCRTKGNEEYDYFSTRTCAVAQFVRETGLCDNPCVGGWHWRDTATEEIHRFPKGFDAECEEPYIFSALADRLEALIADAPLVTT